MITLLVSSIVLIFSITRIFYDWSLLNKLGGSSNWFWKNTDFNVTKMTFLTFRGYECNHPESPTLSDIRYRAWTSSNRYTVLIRYMDFSRQKLNGTPKNQGPSEMKNSHNSATRTHCVQCRYLFFALLSSHF